MEFIQLIEQNLLEIVLALTGIVGTTGACTIFTSLLKKFKLLQEFMENNKELKVVEKRVHEVISINQSLIEQNEQLVKEMKDLKDSINKVVK